MLSTTPTVDSQYKSRIVLPISKPEIFSIDAGYPWFPTLMEGLDIELRFVVRPGSAFLTEWNDSCGVAAAFPGQEGTYCHWTEGRVGRRGHEACTGDVSTSRITVAIGFVLLLPEDMRLEADYVVR